MTIKRAHPHHHAASTTIRTLNLNIKSNPEMSQAKVKHDVRKASHQASLIGWNEISPKRYFQAIKQLGPDWGHYMPHDGKLRIPNPISWKKSEWKLEDSGFVKTHGGKAKVSPNRYITWVKLKNKETGQDVVRVNTHFVSGAFSHGHRPTTAWRQKMWGIHQQKLEHLVDHFKKKGLDVIVAGDFNRDSYHVLGNHVKYDSSLQAHTHGKSTYDYMMHAGGDLRAKGAHAQGGYASDHNAVIGTYKLSGGHNSAAQQVAHTGSAPHAANHANGGGNANGGSASGGGLGQSFEQFFASLLQSLGDLFG
jgi:hypothetical protein